MTHGLAYVTLRENGFLMTPREWENAQWLAALRSTGAQQQQALEALRDLLLRASSYTLIRSLPARLQDQDVVRSMSEDCAQDALIAVLKQLDTFRGESRFTTWAYKFAVHKSLETARRESWKGVSIDASLDDSDGSEYQITVEADTPGPEPSSEQNNLWKLIHQVICEELTERQRLVVKLMVFDDIPMDVVTERLDSNRNAVYKLLHDARLRIRNRIQQRGYSSEEILAMASASAGSEDAILPKGGCL